MNPEITTYIDGLEQKWQAQLCNQIRAVVHQAMPTIVERLQYRKPHFLLNGKYACVLGTAKGWVSFTIFNAKALETPAGLFEASDDGDRKTIKVKEGQALDGELLLALLSKAAPQ